jgi:hypothetical protein
MVPVGVLFVPVLVSVTVAVQVVVGSSTYTVLGEQLTEVLVVRAVTVIEALLLLPL